jgi:hypothetical protein
MTPTDDDTRAVFPQHVRHGDWLRHCSLFTLLLFSIVFIVFILKNDCILRVFLSRLISDLSSLARRFQINESVRVTSKHALIIHLTRKSSQAVPDNVQLSLVESLAAQEGRHPIGTPGIYAPCRQVEIRNSCSH